MLVHANMGGYLGKAFTHKKVLCFSYSSENYKLTGTKISFSFAMYRNLKQSSSIFYSVYTPKEKQDNCI